MSRAWLQLSTSVRSFGKNEQVVFVNGALVMILELVGARIITPYVGSSSFVWTAMIGVMLAALAAGYSWGGSWADKHKKQTLAVLFIVAALLTLLAAVSYSHLLPRLARSFTDVRLLAIMASTLLFAPSAFFMGAISPAVAARHTNSLARAGRSIGRIYAFGTAGSIAGTFLSGFVLLGYMTNKSILLSIASVLVVLAFYEKPRMFRRFAIVLLTVMSGMLLPSKPFTDTTIAEIDTPYSHYAVLDTILQNQSARVLATDKFAWQTGILTQQPLQPAFNYIKAFSYLAEQKQDVKSILILGGGAFSLPAILAAQLPAAKIDVVEIDPALKVVAEEYFAYKNPANVSVHVRDARSYVASSTKSYDIIFVDVFSGLHPPFHLTTSEFVETAKKRLAADGIIAVNTIGSFAGKYAGFPASQFVTYKSHFQYVNTFPVRLDTKMNERENILLLASNSKDIDRYSDLKAEEVDFSDPIVLTDELAPVDRLLR